MRRVVVDEDVRKFYAALADVLFSNQYSASNVVVRVSSR